MRIDGIFGYEPYRVSDKSKADQRASPLRILVNHSLSIEIYPESFIPDGRGGKEDHCNE